MIVEASILSSYMMVKCEFSILRAFITRPLDYTEFVKKGPESEVYLFRPSKIFSSKPRQELCPSVSLLSPELIRWNTWIEAVLCFSEYLNETRLGDDPEDFQLCFIATYFQSSRQQSSDLNNMVGYWPKPSPF